MNNLSNSQNSFCDNILHTILSVDFKKQNNEMNQAEKEYCQIFSDKKVQLHLSDIIIHHISKSLNTAKSAQMRKEKSLQIFEKIISLLDPSIITSTFNAYTISHQLRSLLITSLRSMPPSLSTPSLQCTSTTLKTIIYKLLSKCHDHFSTPMIREGLFSVWSQYYARSGGGKEEDQVKFGQMSKAIYSQLNENKQHNLKFPSITSFQDLKQQIGGVGGQDVFEDYDDKEDNLIFNEVQNPFENERSNSPQKLVKDTLEYIVKTLEQANYSFDYIVDLKQIGNVLKDEYSTIEECKQAFNKFSEMLSKHGITSHEIIESNILAILHDFLIKKNSTVAHINGKTMWNRINVFFTEVIDKPKVVHQFVDCLHKIINDEELIEDLYTSRSSDSDRVKINLDYVGFPDEAHAQILDSFMQSMSKFEKEYDNKDEQKGLTKKQEFSDQAKELDTFYRKTKRLTLMVSNDITMNKLGKFIVEKLKSQEDLDNYYMKRSSNIYIEKHNFRDYSYLSKNKEAARAPADFRSKYLHSMNLFDSFFNRNTAESRPFNLESNIRRIPIGEQRPQNIPMIQNIERESQNPFDRSISRSFLPSSGLNFSDGLSKPLMDELSDEDEDDFEMIPITPEYKFKQSPSKINIRAVILSQDKKEIDPKECIADWVNSNIKKVKSQRSSANLFSAANLEEANTLTFKLFESSWEENKHEDDGSEEDIMFGLPGYRNKPKGDVKVNRTYSLFLQKELNEMSLQDRELERLLSKDLQSGETIRNQLNDGCNILEMLKLIYLLHQNNIRDFLTLKTDDINQRLSRNSINPSKLKNLFVNGKMDEMLKSYLINKHHWRGVGKKDEALVDLVQQFPMIYTFRTRTLSFKLTAFDDMRNRYYASELFTRTIPRSEGGVTISRRKIEVTRENILEAGLAKLKDLQHDSSFLEFQFENEVGTGLGPTLEFYALIGKAIKEEPNMWKETSDNSLYPNPLNLKKKSTKQKRRTEKFFEFVGTIIARSIMDERLVDLPISTVFWKLVFSETAVLEDLEKLDKMFYKGLKMIQDMIDKKQKQDEAKPMLYTQADNSSSFINPDWQ